MDWLILASFYILILPVQKLKLVCQYTFYAEAGTGLPIDKPAESLDSTEPLAEAFLGVGASDFVPSFAALASLVVAPSFAGGGGGGIMWGGGACFSFTNICLILERSVAFPGFGPWTTTDGFLSWPLPLFFSSPGISWGMSSAIAFQ